MLTSLQNPLVKQLRKLQRAKERHEQGVFLIEGTHLVEAACLANRPLATVCYTVDWQAKYPQLWQRFTQQAHRSELVSPEVLAAIATTVTPDGVVATIPRESMPPPQIRSLGIVVETLQDPGNLGTIIRTAAAVEADGLILSQDSVEPDHPKVLRASVGQWFQLPMQVSPDLAATITELRHQGLQVVATLPTAPQTFWEVDFCRPTVLLLGNEGNGLSDAIAALADCAVQIPLAEKVESLNVAIAAALMLYEVKRQRVYASQEGKR